MTVSMKSFQPMVAKACHHGSGDVSYTFLEKIKPIVTIISSGDNESHDHPKPEIVAASAMTGHKIVEDDKMKTPMVYSTELARSIGFGHISKAEVNTGIPHPLELSGVTQLKRVETEYKTKSAGDRTAKTKKKALGRRPIVSKLLYGLVNVRTDGKRVLCAVMNEKKHT